MKGGSYRRGAVCVTSYGMVSSNPELFRDPTGKRAWDYIMLDEGHKVHYALYGINVRKIRSRCSDRSRRCRVVRHMCM